AAQSGVQRYGLAALPGVLDQPDAVVAATTDEASGVPHDLADHAVALGCRGTALVGKNVARLLRAHREQVIVGEAATVKRFLLPEADGLSTAVSLWHPRPLPVPRKGMATGATRPSRPARRSGAGPPSWCVARRTVPTGSSLRGPARWRAGVLASRLGR